MAKFRYKGKVVAGEIEDDDGNIIPNIVSSVEMYGFKFSSKNYTEIPDDKVAYIGRVLNYKTGTRDRTPVTVADKLRGNNHFEEKVEPKSEKAA